jgi:exopolysaccharide production protein ExoQ
MLPNLILLFGCGFVWWLFRMDMRWRQIPSRASWIVGIWLALASSRSPGFWVSAVRSGGGGASSNLEGDPVNVIVNGTLFLLAILVLKRRGFSWGRFALANKALFAIFAFFLCSALWSSFPLPTVKRLVQEFGCVLIAPILLTEKDPGASVRVVFARVSYVLFPLSVVFIRYFPHIGRNVSEVSGSHMVCGVADHKNSLGLLTMVFCLVLLWDLMETRNGEPAPRAKLQRWARLANLGIGLYLLFICESATSLMCFLLGLGLFFAGKRLARMRNARRVFVMSVLSFLCLLSLEQMYGISSRVSVAMGRGEGLSGRREIWAAILEKNTNHLIGAGFRGFWESSEGEAVWRELGTNRLLSSHNGYLEIYVQGGITALFLLFAFILSTGLNAADKLVRGDPLGTLAVIFWPILLISNVTESTFLQIGILWFVMLLVTFQGLWETSFVARRAGATVSSYDERDEAGDRSPVAATPVVALA